MQVLEKGALFSKWEQVAVKYPGLFSLLSPIIATRNHDEWKNKQ